MGRKETILTVAKDIMIEYKFVVKDRSSVEGTAADIGGMLRTIIKEVQKAYNEISE